jgi:hypothetical protein
MAASIRAQAGRAVKLKAVVAAAVDGLGAAEGAHVRDAETRVHHAARRHGYRMAIRGARAAADDDAGDWIDQRRDSRHAQAQGPRQISHTSPPASAFGMERAGPLSSANDGARSGRLRAPGRGPEGPFARSDANDPFETSPPFKRASRTPKLFVAPDGASRRCRPRIMGAEHTVGGYFTLLFIYQSWAKPFAPCDVDVQLHSGRES